MMADEHLVPDLVLVSPSKRTRQTWEKAETSLGKTDVRFERGIYEAPADRLLGLIRDVDDSVRTVVLVGHNPGVSDLARALVGHGDRYAFARLRSKFVTAGVAVIDFAVDHWADVKPGEGRLDRFVVPSATDD
jgi:phosphohistidine phosphatase